MTDQPMPPEAELARLADGSLPADREADLRAQVQQSPELAAALAEQERVVKMMRSLDEPAPAALHARVAELTGERGEGRAARPRARWRLGPALAIPGVTALAVLIAALVVLIGGAGGAPTVPQAAHLALASSTLPAPLADPSDPTKLQISQSGIQFPNWPNWKVTGARRDEVGGRTITTVFYENAAGTRVGYAIVSGPPIAGVKRSGYSVNFTLAHQGSARLITWVRDGHTCVIAGHAVHDAVLLGLAGSESGS
jgi:hypothetical protein